MRHLLLASLFIVTQALAEDIPGQELLSYFSANCRTQGEWTKAALADSTSLIQALQSISQDPDCRSMSGAISQLQVLNEQLLNIENLNSTKIQIAQLNAQEQQLIIHLSQATNPDTQTEINKTLRDLQVARAGLVSSDQAQKELLGPDKGQLMAGLVQAANTTFNQLVGNQKCLAKNYGLLNTASSVVSAIGATAAVVNPALGFGLTAGSTFLGQTVEGIRGLRYSHSIRRLSDNSIASEAYKCALETMSERWCQMRDAESFLNFKAGQRGKDIQKLNLGKALRLNDREVPVIIEWLNHIRSGVTPTTTADASRQSLVFQRDSLLRSLEVTGLGVLAENKNIYQGYTSLDEKWRFLRSVINTLLPATMTTVKNPMYDVLTIGYAPYFLLGLADDATIRNSLGYIDFNTWQKPPGFNPTIETVKQKYIQWVSMARIRVDQERALVQQPDALEILTVAFDKMGNSWKLSPMDSLANLISFLEKYPPREVDAAFTQLYAGTLIKLKEIYHLVQSGVIIDPDKGVAISDPKVPVEKIYELAQLQYGTVVLESRLDILIRLALLELLETTPPADQLVVAQLLAAERFTETISQMSGTENLAVIKADINRAQPITISNLNSFLNVFEKNINRILKRLHKEELKSTGTVAKAKRYARTEMCFLLLSVPDTSGKIDLEHCEGLKLEAAIPGGPESITLTKEVFQKDLNDRACTYREHFRKSKIFENWGIL